MSSLPREFYMPKNYTYTTYGPEYDNAVIGIGDDVKGCPCWIGFAGKKAKPDRYEGYRGIDAQTRRDKAVTDYLEGIKNRLEEKAKIQAAKHNFTNPYKVGDIVYDSWGYDQTNIDFYQITEVKAKSVVIREISQKQVEGDGWGGQVVAIKDNFTGEPMKKNLVGVLDRQGNSIGHISSKHGWISPWDGKPKHFTAYA